MITVQIAAIKPILLLQKLSIKWKRPSEIFKNKKEKFYLFKDEKNINKSNVKQGNIADCYFISSLIALSFHPQIIFKLFKIKSINQKGYYEIILFIEGQYQIVVIDDYLPVCTDTNELCFSRSIMDNEIWICLLEKAWAKINGGYENIIKGYAHHVLEALTGFQLLITHLDGRKVLINSKKGEIIKPGTIQTVKECGMPFFDHPTQFGNLYIKFNIIFPKKIKEEQKTSLQELFPKIVMEIKDIKSIKEKYFMSEFNENEMNKEPTGGNKNEEEEEQSYGPRQQVRCENQ